MSADEHRTSRAGEAKQDEVRPEWQYIALKAAPRLGDIYWCDFHAPEYVHLPEMWKRRPVIVVSRKNVIKGAVMILPFSTNEKNSTNKMAYPVPEAVIEKLGADISWVLCDHICTVANSRLRPTHGKVLTLKGAELSDILTLMHSALGAPQQPAGGAIGRQHSRL